MLRALSRPATRIMERWLPDPLIFVVLLTLIAAVAAMLSQQTSPVAIVRMWGNGFWELLAFSMQMLLVLATGFILATAPPVKRLLSRLAEIPKTPGAAIITISFVGLAASWINWGFGLIVAAVFARELAMKIKVDYRLLVASGYSGYLIWHGGLSGSIPLTISTPGHLMEGQIGIIGTDQTIFSWWNLTILALCVIVVPIVNRLMLPSQDESVFVDRAKLATQDTPADLTADATPAQRMENSRLLMWLPGGAGLLWVVLHFIDGGSINLNLVNMLFLSAGLVLHGTARSLLASLDDAVKAGSGIVVQFPFYAGIMAIIAGSGLAETLTDAFVHISSQDTLAFWTFVSAGILNMFVPSGGGQWAVQGPIMMPAAQALSVDSARIAMAIAWGDAWTNLLQPFWALPMLGIAGLKARDIMGFCVVLLLVTGIVIGGCFLLL